MLNLRCRKICPWAPKSSRTRICMWIHASPATLSGSFQSIRIFTSLYRKAYISRISHCEPSLSHLDKMTQVTPPPPHFYISVSVAFLFLFQPGGLCNPKDLLFIWNELCTLNFLKSCSTLFGYLRVKNFFLCPFNGYGTEASSAMPKLTCPYVGHCLH